MIDKQSIGVYNVQVVKGTHMLQIFLSTKQKLGEHEKRSSYHSVARVPLLSICSPFLVRRG